MSESSWGTDTDLWPTIPPPFLPVGEDLDLVRRACPPGLLEETAKPRILVLGVTPALVGAPWPAASEVHAVDFDQAMIDILWVPQDGRQCHCERWQEMPFPDGYFDLVIGDCSFNALPRIAEYGAVLKEIGRVRRPSAPLVCRFFVQPEPRLTLKGLAGEEGRRFAHYAPYSRQLLISIGGALPDGSLHLADLPDRIRTEFGDVDEFLTALGQTPDSRERAWKTFEFDLDLNYPNRRQIAEIFGAYFEKVEFIEPGYDCGEFCLTVHCR